MADQQQKSARLRAAEQHQTTYVSGEACPAGHNGARYTLSSNCVECQRVWNAEHKSKYRKLLKGGAANG